MSDLWKCLDGNEAAARVAYALSEVIAIYPITPASPMAEKADDWAAAGRPNLWGVVPQVVQLQSEAGAAGTLHGALQKGALGTTFTSSQGLLLMVPSMYRIAGELTPTVFHVAARSLSTHALSIFGDHMDVMATRATGFAMLCSSSVQEAQDLALVAHVASLRSRVPFLHFFDGFRTSHEIQRIEVLPEEVVRAQVPQDAVLAQRARGLDPEHPVIRGTAQNPDSYFQSREASNPYYLAVPGLVQEAMDALAAPTGRKYGLVEYEGDPEAERVVVLMGSGVGAAQEAVEALNDVGEGVGLLKVRLFRPFPSAQLAAALPPSVRALAVLDRTKEPGAPGEPLYLDVLAALYEDQARELPSLPAVPLVTGGRYGLSQKELTPAMVKAVFDDLGREHPKRQFTVGIRDDVTHLSLEVDAEFRPRRPAGEVQALFFGLGSDGTVGANKASVKIIGESAGQWAQGYFVYDSKKSGSLTVSHLRFGPEPIRSSYTIQDADFVACHQFGLLERLRILDSAKQHVVVLLNSPWPAGEVWDHLPREAQEQLIEHRAQLWVIDAYAIAEELGLGNRINTIMQPCFFKLSGVLPPDEAVVRIKESVLQAYGRRGPAIVEQNFAAIDRSLAGLQRVKVPAQATSEDHLASTIPGSAPTFVKEVTSVLMAGAGDTLPVSRLPADGTFPPGTTKYEKRSIAKRIPIWDPEICIQCGKCAMVCPHATIRMKAYPAALLEDAPASFKHRDFRVREAPDLQHTVQVAPDDCTGCGVCVDVCPAKSRTEVRHKAIDMLPAGEHRPAERQNWLFFERLPRTDRALLPHDTVRGAQLLEPLFEFSGACAGCGETPYVRLVSQLFGDRMVVSTATGCASIYSASLPTAAWTTDTDGRGPAWNSPLFEDAAEFGLGLRLGYEAQARAAAVLLRRLGPQLGDGVARELLETEQVSEEQIASQRARVDGLRRMLAGLDDEDARHLEAVADSLVRQSIWVIGGDGWAYDIGYGGLDHVLASGRDLNLLVLDTEVYSNTGGQASKATSRGAVAKFASSGKAAPKKDLGAVARAYGNVYVAQVSMGANDTQVAKAFIEAEAWPGPSLIIAYSTCIAHGIDMSKSMTHQKDAVRSGYWPIYRFRPSESTEGRPFTLDSKPPSIPLRDFVATEARFAILQRSYPQRAERLLALAQQDVDERRRLYEQLAEVERTAPSGGPVTPEVESDAGYTYEEEAN